MVLRTKRRDSAASGKGDEFWGRLINDDGKGTQLMWRLADSVFFHMQAQTRVWHGIDASQLFWLLSTVALEDDDAIDARIMNLARYLDDASIHHTPVIVNGQQVPTMDRTSWFALMCHEARTAPEYAHKWWANLFLALPLQDPNTRRPFPSPPPRSSFPGSPHPSPAFSPESKQLHSKWNKPRSKTLQPESHEPEYVFLPRVAKTEDEDRKPRDKARLQKLPKFFGGGEKRLSKPPPEAPPVVTFVADGRMRKAHVRAGDGGEAPLPPRPSTATGHYEIPPARAQSPAPPQRWPDTRGIPGLSRRDPPPPSLSLGLSRNGAVHRPPPTVTAQPDDMLVPVAPQPDAVDISTEFGPGGEAMQAVVSRALVEQEPPPPPKKKKMSLPLRRRHSSQAILSPLVEKTEGESFGFAGTTRA